MTISRRNFMQEVIVVSAAIGANILPGSAWANVSARSEDPAGWRVLTADQARLLTAVLNRLVPNCGEMPAAGDLGVASFIDDVLAAAPHLRAPVLEPLLMVQAGASRARPTRECELDLLLEETQRARPESFEVLLRATYVGYYSHPHVLATLGAIDEERPVSVTSQTAALHG